MHHIWNDFKRLLFSIKMFLLVGDVMLNCFMLLVYIVRLLLHNNHYIIDEEIFSFTIF